ncbi:MAG TPA: APC family permease [Tepidisphaeraceae bacterium]|nr:APC family permease [Tepidisphaeraceae bacterium]
MASIPSTNFDVAQLPDAAARRKINVLLVSSVALAFISFWRAAAIVLCDLASTAYYIGGISEQAIGKAAPWFILGVMLFSYAVRSVYVESCTMFTRGGVYRVVRGAIGGNLAKLSVSALMFDYVLTGPISAVAAGQYLVGLGGDMLNLLLHTLGRSLIDPTQHQGMVNFVTVLIAVGITLFFWRLNVKGIHESSDKALRIMQLTTVMGILIIGWSVLTLFVRHIGLHLPPFHPVFTQSSKDPGRESSAGWLEHFPKILGMLGILVAFGHSLLAMSGEESLAQVNREIKAPKLRNLLLAGFVIFVYSMLLTSLISFFAVLIIPDGMRVTTQIVRNGHAPAAVGVDYTEVDYVRKSVPPGGSTPVEWGYVLNRGTDADGQPRLEITQQVKTIDRAAEHVERDNGGYRDNLINGLVHFLVGPAWLKIIMECFVVIVGFAILAGAVNTSIIGSNGVMNRLAEDGVLTPWFLHPQKRYGTTHRLINLVAILQLIVICASWGDVNTLGEAYAFGVIWSFVFMTLAMVVFRFKDKSPRQYRVPLNIRIRRPSRGDYIDIPIGIAIVCMILLSTALINLATKKTATIWGCGFTAAFLIAFVICETVARRRRGGGHHEHLEQFNEEQRPEVTVESVGLGHRAPILVAARGPRSLPMLEKVLRETDTQKRDIVVVTCKLIPPRTRGVTQQEMSLDDGDRGLLTKIVTVAEEVGKRVFPVVMPTNNPLYAIACTARDLNATEVVLGVSEKFHAEEQLEQFALAWGSATAEPGANRPMTVRILGPQIEIREQME